VTVVVAGTEAPKKIGVYIFEVFNRVGIDMPPENILAVDGSNNLEIELTGNPAVDPPHRSGGIKVGGCSGQVLSPFAYRYELNI
jgi:hypothetical protein